MLVVVVIYIAGKCGGSGGCGCDRGGCGGKVMVLVVVPAFVRVVIVLGRCIRAMVKSLLCVVVCGGGVVEMMVVVAGVVVSVVTAFVVVAVVMDKGALNGV